MTRVGLCRTTPSYQGLAPPFDPEAAYPELRPLLGEQPRLAASNRVYAAVRLSLMALGLDTQRFGTPDWNPLGELVPRGGSVVLKPNFIRHWNPCPEGTTDSLITHGAVL